MVVGGWWWLVVGCWWLALLSLSVAIFAQVFELTLEARLLDSFLPRTMAKVMKAMKAPEVMIAIMKAIMRIMKISAGLSARHFFGGKAATTKSRLTTDKLVKNKRGKVLAGTAGTTLYKEAHSAMYVDLYLEAHLGIDQEEAPGTTTNLNFGAGARYCPHCVMWLNGPAQWSHHKKGKKHWKNSPRSVPRAVLPTIKKQRLK